MANITSTFVKNIEVTYNGVNYLLKADLEIDLDTGDIVAIDNLEGWICDCYWVSVTPKTSSLNAAKYDDFQDAVRESAKDRYDIDDVRRELEEE